MKTARIASRFGFVMVGLGALAFSGCVAETEDGDLSEEIVGEAEQAIGAECAGALPTASYFSAINYSSPQTYTTANCYKGVVLDVQSYASTAPAGYWIYTNVGWNDSVPLASQTNHIANCEALWLQADLFEKINGSWVYKGSREDKGNWLTDFPAANTCSAPSVNFNDLMLQGKTYRISATARTYKSSAAPTRKLRVLTSFVDPPK